MQFSWVMRNMYKDAERRHRSENHFLDGSPSVSRPRRIKDNQIYLHYHFLNCNTRYQFCSMQVGNGGEKYFLVKNFWKQHVLNPPDRSESYIKESYAHQYVRALRSSAANKTVEPHTPTFLFFFQRIPIHGTALEMLAQATIPKLSTHS